MEGVWSGVGGSILLKVKIWVKNGVRFNLVQGGSILVNAKCLIWLKTKGG